MSSIPSSLFRSELVNKVPIIIMANGNGGRVEHGLEGRWGLWVCIFALEAQGRGCSALAQSLGPTERMASDMANLLTIFSSFGSGSSCLACTC